MLGKLIFVSVVVCIISLLVNIEFTSQIIRTSLLPKVLALLPSSQINRESDGLKVLSQQELSKYKGHDGGLIYLAVVGHVFDVTRGKKHYGPGGGYEFFSGIDGSKGYVTGQFDKDGLIDDISDFSSSQILSLEQWRTFYEKDYKLIGLVEGAFFDKNGKELEPMAEYKRKLLLAEQEKSLLEKDRKLFPPCNSEWNQANGGRVWCSTLSGGISRSWAGVPRMYYTAGNSKPRCACVRTIGPPSHDLKRVKHNNNGDLDNPNLSVYPQCSPLSESCPLIDN